MIAILTDDLRVELFESANSPPNWIEGIDIENSEYQFCALDGQKYLGVVDQPSGLFRQAHWHLEPNGIQSIQNILDLLTTARELKPNPYFPDLPSLRRHIQSGQAEQDAAANP